MCVIGVSFWSRGVCGASAGRLRLGGPGVGNEPRQPLRDRVVLRGPGGVPREPMVREKE